MGSDSTPTRLGLALADRSYLRCDCVSYPRRPCPNAKERPPRGAPLGRHLSLDIIAQCYPLVKRPRAPDVARAQHGLHIPVCPLSEIVVPQIEHVRPSWYFRSLPRGLGLGRSVPCSISQRRRTYIPRRSSVILLSRIVFSCHASNSLWRLPLLRVQHGQASAPPQATRFFGVQT